MIPNLTELVDEAPFPRSRPPKGWLFIAELTMGPAGYAYRNGGGLKVIESIAEHDGRLWRHVSVSRATRLPSWDDLKVVKAAFIGGDRPAIQVLPSLAEYVNLHPHCLHLWAPHEVTP